MGIAIHPGGYDFVSHFQIRFTAAEYAAVEAAAGGSYVSDWIRKLILGNGAVVRLLGSVPALVAADIEAAWSRVTEAAILEGVCEFRQQEIERLKAELAAKP